MSEVHLEIDGTQVAVEQGTTVLEAARGIGVPIPTLCHHEDLAPYGGCRLCIVEAESNGRKNIACSCVYPAEEGMVVKTQSEQLSRMRKTIIELFMSHAPDAPQLTKLAKEYGAERDRFEKDPSFCIHCGLCVRYCAEVKQKHVVGFIDRGVRKEISFIPDLARAECEDCKECFPLCPTSYLQAAYVLTQSLAFPTEKP
jgi:bidirectional [NiFe] hydrogenase diaphorase subunit